MSEQKISGAERITINALESSNPFQTKIKPPARGGQAQKQAQPKTPEQPVVERVEVENVPLPEPKKPLQEALPVDPVDRSQIAPATVYESRSEEGLPSYRCEFAGRDVFVGWPWYKTTNPVTAAVNVAMALDFGRDKIRFDMIIGDAMVYHSRNKIADAFLQTDAKWLLMMDDDIIPSIGRPMWMKYWVEAARKLPDKALSKHVLQRLLGTGKTLVGCAYFGRQEGGKLMCSDQRLERAARAYEERVEPVDWIGTGCLLVHRSVFDAIRETNPELAPIQPGEPWDYFQPFGNGRGEDVSFCYRAKKAGHQPHIDLSIPTFHVGYKSY
jgi:hypothetical protein